MKTPSIAAATLLILAFSVAGAATPRQAAASRAVRPAAAAPGSWRDLAQSLWNVVRHSITTETSLSTPNATTSTGSCIDPDGRLVIPCVHPT